MFFKISISTLIVILSALVGYIISLTYDIRIKQLSAFIYSIKIMEAEMNYSKSYLHDIVNKLSTNNEKVIADLYKKVCKGLQNNSGKEFTILWNDSVEQALNTSSLTQTDIRLIKDFGKSIGKIDLKNQKKIYDYFLKRLDLQLEDAREEKNKKSRVYKNLGVAIGIMVVVVLI